MITMTKPVARSYRFNLGMLPEEVNQISDTFCRDCDSVGVYKENGSIYAEFWATEHEIDSYLEEACSIILHYYHHLSLVGASFVV